MSFMKPQVYEGTYFSVDTTNGTEILPADLFDDGATEIEASQVKDYIEGDLYYDEEALPLQHGWLARMSAPGYMDRTDWMAFETEWAATVYLVEHYMDDTHCVMDIPSHFLSALVNGDTTGLTDEDEKALDLFVRQNPEANGVEGSSEDHNFDGYQDVTECICRLPKD